MSDDNAQLTKIEMMLQVALEAICSLSKEATGKSMVIGYFDDGLSISATPLSKNIKLVEGE
ncbi:MAG: hypothetical protein WD669_01870 [Pirellulales bacterium]